jgi:hypothetical protein
MNLKHSLMTGSLVAALSTGMNALAADGYCTIPLLYATNIRPHCEQFGSSGLDSLFTGSMMFEQMLNRPHIADVFPAPKR